MADDTNTPETQPTGEQAATETPEAQTPAVAQTTDTGASEHMIPKARFDELNARAKAAEAELKKLQKAQTDAERKRAEEQGKFEDLYKDTQAKLEAAESAAREAEEKARQAELSSLRSKIAAKHKLPDLLAERLRGDTEEEIEADAKALAETLPKAIVSTATDAQAGVNTRTPTPTISDEEIQEQAAVYGVNAQFLKDYYQKQRGN